VPRKTNKPAIGRPADDPPATSDLSQAEVAASSKAQTPITPPPNGDTIGTKNVFPDGEGAPSTGGPAETPAPPQEEASVMQSQLDEEVLPHHVIGPEPEDTIRVAAGGKLVVPREDFDDGLDDGAELDLVGSQPMKVRKPHRRDWIALSRKSELPTRLLVHKPKADDIDVEHYYVDPSLRGPISDELKQVRVFVYYSFRSKIFGLWIINVTPDNSWYECLVQLLQRPEEFFASRAVRVISDKPNSRYRVRHKPLPSDVAWPRKETGELLAEALGPERFIRSKDHPLYRDLVEGEELG
jgi:hypothetical protein